MLNFKDLNIIDQLFLYRLYKKGKMTKLYLLSQGIGLSAINKLLYLGALDKNYDNYTNTYKYSVVEDFIV